MNSDPWPRLDTGKAWVVAALVVGSIVVGIENRNRVFDMMHDALCTPTTCSGPGYALAGWLFGGAPILALAAIYLYARPGWPALGAMVGCLCWLTGGLATYGLREAEVAEQLRTSHPQRMLLTPGIVAGLAAFGIGLALARAVRGVSTAPPAYVEFERWSPRIRARHDDDPARRRLFLVGICEIVALAVSVLWAVSVVIWS